MGKITLIAEGSTVGEVAKGGGIVEAVEFTSEETALLVECAMESYATDLANLKDAEGNPRAATMEDVIRLVFKGFLKGWANNATAYKKQKAMKAAAEAVEPFKEVV
jgi:hypothetical protein